MPGLDRDTLSRNVIAVRGADQYYMVADYMVAEFDFDDLRNLQAAFRSSQGQATASYVASLADHVSVKSMIYGWPVLVQQVSETAKMDYDWLAEMPKWAMPVMLVVGDADGLPQSHGVDFFALLGGGQRDAVWDRSGMTHHRLSILPGVTHYDINVNPALTAAVTAFLMFVHREQSKVRPQGSRDRACQQVCSSALSEEWVMSPDSTTSWQDGPEDEPIADGQEGAERERSASTQVAFLDRLGPLTPILIFDVAGPLAVYYGARSAGLSTVVALLSGVLPAVRVIATVLRRRRLDAIGALVLSGIVLGTVTGLVTGSARLYLLDGLVPTVVLGAVCMASLLSSRPMMFRIALETMGEESSKGQAFADMWPYPEFRRMFRSSRSFGV